MSLHVLIVCSVNRGKLNSFIEEQAQALVTLGVQISYFTITKPGFKGYVQNYIQLLAHIRQHQYNLIHAHYGLSALIAGLQRRLPVVATFHGSDVNQKTIKPFSLLASRLSTFNILVEKSFQRKLKLKDRFAIIPCGIDFSNFISVSKQTARQALNWNNEDFIILFSSSFSNPVKNYPLAKKAVAKIKDASLIELKGYTRTEINLLMHAADALLLTSFNEGSPQVVKEALACNLPVVTTPVGDVRQLLENTDNNHIVDYHEDLITSKLLELQSSRVRSNGRNKAIAYDNQIIAKRILSIYQQVADQSPGRGEKKVNEHIKYI